MVIVKVVTSTIGGLVGTVVKSLLSGSQKFSQGVCPVVKFRGAGAVPDQLSY